MKILATCLLTRANTASGRRPARGFTLLELLVVLTLMAAMTSLALPQLAKLLDAGQRSFERGDLLDALAALPYQAFEQQQGFTLRQLPGQDEDVPLRLPEGWLLKAADENGVSYLSNGFCSGGTVLMGKDGQQEEILLVPPLCEPRLR